MVVLAGAITTKTGKALLSRQFVEMTKARIEGLISAFPKLMSTEKQHTFVESEAVRYVYQPIGENLYILVITNKNSNILEDLEALHLLAKIVPEYCHTLEEKEILKHAFEIIFAFDEAVALGYKERVNIGQIKLFTSMESPDEIRAKLEQKNKELIAKRQAEQQRKAIEKRKAEEKRSGISSEDIRNTYISNSAQSSNRSTFQNEPVVESKRETPTLRAPERPAARGMQLGSKSKQPAAYAQVLQEENVPEPASPSVSASNNNNTLSTSASAHSGVAQESKEGRVHITAHEDLFVTAENDGGLKQFEVRGELSVTVNDPALAKVKIKMTSKGGDEFQYKTHPNINKALFTSDNILALKDPNKQYQLGNKTSILKWRYVTNDENQLPISINVWPNPSGKETVVPVEYEKKAPFDLVNFVVAIPIVSGKLPIAGDCEGTTEFDPKAGNLLWKIPLIEDSNSSGTLEFKLPGNVNNQTFFPTRVSFEGRTTIAGIELDSVGLEDGKVVAANSSNQITFESHLLVNQYDIE